MSIHAPVALATAVLVAAPAVGDDHWSVPAPDPVLQEVDLLETPAVMLAAMQDEAAPVEEEHPWKGKAFLGATASFGNTDEQDVAGNASLKRELEHQITTFNLAVYMGFSDGDRTDNKARFTARNDWLVPDSPWFYFGQGRAEYDEFQSWEYRLSAVGGVGYVFEDRDDLRVAGRFGLGGSKEFNSPDEELRFEALLGLDIDWQVSDTTTFTFTTELYPDLSNGGEFRSLTRGELAVLLDSESNLSLTVAAEHEYQSDTAPGVKPNDVRLAVGLQVDF